MINLLEEIGEMLNEHNLNINDVVFVVDGNIVENEDFLEKYDVCYNHDWGLCNFSNIQVVIDDYTWFERTSYDGREKFVLKAHPILSDYQNQEFHTRYFYE